MCRRLLIGILSVALANSAFGKPGDRCEGGSLVKGPCVTVRGEMRVWNGWPPNLRIESDGRVFGVGPIEDEIFPSGWVAFMPTAIRGTFRLCSLGTETRVPYLEQPIPLYCVESVKDGERFVAVSGESHWEPIK